MKDAILEKVLTTLGYLMGTVFMGGAVWLCWELLWLLFTTIVRLVS